MLFYYFSIENTKIEFEQLKIDSVILFKHLLKKFIEYLTEKQFSKHTIKSNVTNLRLFLNFCNNKQLDYKKLQSKHIIKYIRHLKKTNTNQSVQRHLITLNHLYTMIRCKSNPVFSIQKRKIERINLNNSIHYDYLIDLYNEYTCDTDTQFRNKILLGLIVFQGVRANEIQNIMIDDVDLQKMTIKISKSKYINERTLQLHSLQILHLYKYLNEVRSRLTTCDSKQLIISKRSTQLNNVRSSLIRQLQKTDKTINYNIIRKSVIIHWLTNNDLRYVQYFCGHKYISSTENYCTQNLKQLQQQVIQCFPLK